MWLILLHYKGRKNCSAVKSPCSSCRGPWFQFQHPLLVVHDCLNLQPQGLWHPLLAPLSAYTHVHIHTYTHNKYKLTKTTLYIIKMWSQGWRDGSAVVSKQPFCRGPGFNSRPHIVSHNHHSSSCRLSGALFLPFRIAHTCIYAHTHTEHSCKI